MRICSENVHKYEHLKIEFFFSSDFGVKRRGHVLDCVREVHPRTLGPVLSVETSTAGSSGLTPVTLARCSRSVWEVTACGTAS